MKFHKDSSLPGPATIFVFGSNRAGIHGAGAALAAARYFGACPGVGAGPHLDSYAIPTKGFRLEVMPLDFIQTHVWGFLNYARCMPEKEFFVTRIGCGYAGYTDRQIAPMFRDAPSNCSFATQWRSHLETK